MKELMMTGYTSGPWEAVDIVGAGWNVRRQFERPGYTGLAPICSMAWFQFPIPGIIDDEISEANAKLIAAAPELLEQLRLAVECIKGEGFSKSVYSDMQKAIDKATSAVAVQ